MSVGGASDSEASDVIVHPTRSSPSPQAMIATPEDSARIAWRKAALSAWRDQSLTLALDQPLARLRAAVSDRRGGDEAAKPGREEAGGSC